MSNKEFAWQNLDFEILLFLSVQSVAMKVETKVLTKIKSDPNKSFNLMILCYFLIDSVSPLLIFQLKLDFK